ncbi:MAG: glutathione ABC transporter substrate-binding protein [Acetobacteraceae bacterium]|nr:glutathione ABC transporter substrate-binding protein [Acetobacteraceae bacterium]
MTLLPPIPRRFFIGGSAALVAAPALAPLAARAAEGKSLTIGVQDNLTGLDPADLNDNLSLSACRTMFQGLYGFDKDMKLIPALAESYTANDAATEFTFKLQSNVVFHDGTPFNAAAVKFSLERLANPENKLKRASLLSMLDHVDALDDHTVKIVLKTPFGAFVPTVAHPALMIVSPAAVAKYGRDFNRNPVGTGPFKFVSWSADTLKVERNDKFWRAGYPKLNAVTFRSVPENGARLAMLQTGEAQFIYPLPPELIRVVERNQNISVINNPSIYARYVAMNVTKKPFGDPRVRQALNYGIDKAAFAKIVWSGYEDPLDSPLPPNLAFYQKQGSYPYDLARAKKLLADAGVGEGFTTEMWANNNSINQRGLQFMQQQFGNLGIKLTVTPLEAALLQQKIFTVPSAEESQLQTYLGAWSASTGDADWGLRPLFWSKGAPPRLFNVGYYKNDEVDAAIEGGLGTADASKRGGFYAQAQKLIWEDAPWIFLGVDRNLAGQAKTLAGVYQMPDSQLLIEEGSFSA